MSNYIDVLKADLLLLLAALIWGSAFVAQRVGMDYLPPFYFNGLRFLLGGGCLLVFICFSSAKKQLLRLGKDKGLLSSGIILGCLLFLASSLQQVGMQYTTAGKAGFITSLYVVIVPLLGIFLKQKVNFGIVLGVILSVVGLYLLSIKSNFSMDKGDFLVLLCAFVFSIHVLAVSFYAYKYDCLVLAFLQFITTGILSLLVAFGFEVVSLSAIREGALPLIYGGMFSVAIAYTLQIIAQKSAPPAHAAIILSLESVFAALTGWIILGESLSLRAKLGCALMLVGVLIAQVWPYLFKRNT